MSEKDENKMLTPRQKYYRKHKERVQAQSKAYIEKNRDKWNAYQRQYARQNREKRTASRRKWREKNKEKDNARHRAYYEENKENMRRMYRAARAAQRHTVLDNECVFCGSTENLERHHPDYDKPLEFLTFCRKCHRQLHVGLITLEVIENA